MATTTELTDDLVSQLSDPASSTADGQSATARPVGEVIKGITFGAAEKALAKRRRGMTFGKIIAPGPLCDNGGIVAVPPFGGGITG